MPGEFLYESLAYKENSYHLFLYFSLTQKHRPDEFDIGGSQAPGSVSLALLAQLILNSI